MFYNQGCPYKRESDTVIVTTTYSDGSLYDCRLTKKNKEAFERLLALSTEQLLGLSKVAAKTREFAICSNFPEGSWFDYYESGTPVVPLRFCGSNIIDYICTILGCRLEQAEEWLGDFERVHFYFAGIPCLEAGWKIPCSKSIKFKLLLPIWQQGKDFQEIASQVDVLPKNIDSVYPKQ